MDPEELEEAIAKLVQEHYEKNIIPTKSPWAISAATLPGYVAALTFLLGLIFAYSDFKVNLTELNSRLNTQSERLLNLDKRLTDLDEKGSRPLLSNEATIKSLKEQVESLKDALENVNTAIIQHNETMFELYKKQNLGKPFILRRPMRLNLLPIPDTKRLTELE